MQKVEALRLRELLRLRDAGGEGIPRHYGLDGGERIAAALFGFQQGLADAAIHPHLVIVRLAGSLKLLLMLVPGRIEQLADLMVDGYEIKDAAVAIGVSVDRTRRLWRGIKRDLGWQAS